MILLKTRDEVALMREAGRLLAETFSVIENNIKAGITGHELDRIAEKHIRENGAEPAFKGYRGYPSTICLSVNETVVHGIPGESRLREGDLVSIDVGLKLNGFYADAARTYGVGMISAEAQRLLEVTEAALDKGIDACKSGGRLGDVSAAVQTFVEKAGYSVVRDLVGHGIGKSMHEDPPVPNFGVSGTGPVLKEGMVFAIEPMVNAGKHEINLLKDGWSVVTADLSLSAHFENTVAVTDEGPEILTVI